MNSIVAKRQCIYIYKYEIISLTEDYFILLKEKHFVPEEFSPKCPVRNYCYFSFTFDVNCIAIPRKYPLLENRLIDCRDGVPSAIIYFINRVITSLYRINVIEWPLKKSDFVLGNRDVHGHGLYMDMDIFFGSDGRTRKRISK